MRQQPAAQLVLMAKPARTGPVLARQDKKIAAALVSSAVQTVTAAVTRLVQMVLVLTKLAMTAARSGETVTVVCAVVGQIPIVRLAAEWAMEAAVQVLTKNCR